MIRTDQSDLIYKTEEAKYIAVVDDVVERYEKGQPVLIGTTSVERSEYLSRQFPKRRIPHNVLNAKYHEQEAGIIAEAGRRGAITVATNMAGRGTDIVLGGNVDFLADKRLRERGLDPVETPEEYEAAWDEVLPQVKAEAAEEAEDVIAVGGLYVLGTERHESRRIDNQLRGRSGRQGDPGESRFYLSLGDELMRRFNGETLESLLNRLQPARRRAHRGQDGLPRDQERADAGRAAELRGPQERPQVRRGDEPAAQGHLRRAPPHPRGREPAGAGPQDADRRGHRVRRRCHRRGLRRRLGPGSAVEGAEARCTRSASTTTTSSTPTPSASRAS